MSRRKFFRRDKSDISQPTSPEATQSPDVAQLESQAVFKEFKELAETNQRHINVINYLTQADKDASGSKYQYVILPGFGEYTDGYSLMAWLKTWPDHSRVNLSLHEVPTQTCQQLAVQNDYTPQLLRHLEETKIAGKELRAIKVIDSSEHENGIYIDCKDTDGIRLLTHDDTPGSSDAATNRDSLSKKIGWTSQVLEKVVKHTQNPELNPHLQHLFIEAGNLGELAVDDTAVE